MNSSPFKRLWNHNREWRLSAMKASFFSFLNKLFDIAPEILIGVAVDLVVKREESFISSLGFVTPESQLLVLGVATFIIWSSESLFEYLYLLGWRNLAQKVQHALRVEAFSRSVTHDLTWFESGHSGHYQSVLGEDVNQLERFLDGGINEIIQILVSTVLVSLVFFYLSPVIALVALIPIPLIFFGSWKFQKKLEPRYKDVRESAGLIARRLSGVFSGIITVKSFSMEAEEVSRFSDISNDYLLKNKEAIRVSAAFTPLIRIFVLAGFLFTLVYGGLLTFRGELEAGSYSVLVFLTQRLLWPFTRLGQTVDLYQRAMASTKRIMDIVELEPETERNGHTSSHSVSNGEVNFKGVGFSYGENSVLSNLEFRIPDKKFVGIVGATGSGKTTFAKLLLGFYKPDKGTISLGGTNILEYDSSTLRDAISYVGQDVFLFEGSLKDNITYGSVGVSTNRINEVLRLTKLEELVSDLKDGLETEVGERGVKLSGGQRQRVAIARALLKESKILVLDEATSAVDNDTEKFIKESISTLTGNITIISIAHRLSTIRGADEIVVLERGRISETGTHEKLLANHGTYKKLWDIQTGA